jgi:hypothetical protein
VGLIKCKNTETAEDARDAGEREIRNIFNVVIGTDQKDNY